MKRYKLTLAEQETVINFDNELPTASSINLNSWIHLSFYFTNRFQQLF